MRRWKLIDEGLGLGCPEPPETYSTSSELFEALRIPQDATGTLPTAQRGRAGLDAEDIEDIGETGRTRSPRGKTGGSRGKSSSGRSRNSGHGRDAGHGKGTEHGDKAAGQGSGTRRRVRRRTRRGQDVSTPEQRAS
jgi:hypothetical protein